MQLPQSSKTTLSGVKSVAFADGADATDVCVQSLYTLYRRPCSLHMSATIYTCRQNWQVVTTGHSLGAGVAVLIAARLRGVVAGAQALSYAKAQVGPDNWRNWHVGQAFMPNLYDDVCFVGLHASIGSSQIS